MALQSGYEKYIIAILMSIFCRLSVCNYSGTRSRRPFYDATGESQASAWITFFDSDMGMFLRNAAIFHYPGGMVQFYKDEGVIPQTSIDTGSRTTTDYSVRLYPQSIDATEIAATANLPTTFPVFGWLEVDPPLGDGSVYWLLIADSLNRLVWVAEKAVGHHPSNLNSQNQVDPTMLNPSRAYTDTDIIVIIGG